MKDRDIGHEILSVIEEIKVWQKAGKELKVTRLAMSTARGVIKNSAQAKVRLDVLSLDADSVEVAFPK